MYPSYDVTGNKAHPYRRDGLAVEQMESLSSMDRDQADLARLGKKSVLKRNFGYMPILGFACTVIITWEATFLTLSLGLPSGGPAGLIYGFIFVWLGMLAVFTSIGEMASIAPTSGGQYYWVSMLAPPYCRKFLSYITGWITLIGWQAVSTSTVYLCGSLIQGLVVLVNPSSGGTLWQGTLLLWAMIFFCVFFNTTLGNFLPHVEGLGLVLHIVGFFAIMVPMIYLAPHGSASYVFGTFLNEGNWPTQGVSFMISLNVAVFDFLGSDSVIHMSEEIRGAATVVPQTMILSLLINGTLGLAALVATLFCMGDVDTALASTTGYPFMEIFQSATGSVGGAAFMSVILFIMQTFAAIGLVAATSRMFWAFARDRGLPGWQYLSRVDPTTSIPTVAVAVTVVITCLLGLINLAGPIVFNDVISLTVSALLLSYLFVCGLLLWRRCTGFITYDTRHSQKISISAGNSEVQLYWGPWHVPGVLGIVINVIACAFLVLIIFWSFWPQATPTTADSMNMSVLMLGATIIFAIVWYVVQGRKTYKGPIIELELEN
ncbi:hypothetical protein MMC18_000978 [Xylographa bjoerkii]|nr:hypothetical protein [Xylographa bjoerkii]